MKNKSFQIIFILFLSITLITIFIKKRSYDIASINTNIEAISNHSPSLSKASKNFANNIDLAIKNPENAIQIEPALSKSLSCLNAVLRKENIELTALSSNTSSHNNDSKQDDFDKLKIAEFEFIEKIRDMAITNDPFRVKQYQKFNNNLSGKTFEILEPNIANCAKDF